MKSHFMMMKVLSTLSLLHVIALTGLFSHVQPLCHSEESVALLQFKDSFIIRHNASDDPSAYPKFYTWTPAEKNDCCLWDGVECDETNTHVIALHLNSSCIFGSINSSSSLFHLSHLQILNLADNHFNHSQIPYRLSHLLELTYLNLSYSGFHGQIPLEISQLFNLSYLDLSFNSLEVKSHNLSTLVWNLSKLNYLDLSEVNISSPVPNFLAKFTALTSLILRDCGLYGEFPDGIFQLPNLRFLDLQNNENLTGYLPKFLPGSPLRQLLLRKTGFHGGITSSIGNLTFLSQLDVEECWFVGPVPSSLGRLTNLQYLNLVSNYLSGMVDFNMFISMKSLTQLMLSYNKLSVLRETAGHRNATVPKFETLLLASCNLTSFPDFLRYQDRLKFLDLNSNHIYGRLPNWIKNTSILVMDISINSFVGPPPILPPSIIDFDASYNEMSGEVSPLFFNLSLAKGLHLAHNKLRGVLPLFLNLSSLVSLDLSHNNFGGIVPECTLMRHIKHNISSGAIPQTCRLGPQVWMINLSHNNFKGRLPRSLLANCMNLQILILENNQFVDIFPSWLGALPKLKVLLLQSNHFHGEITTTNKSASDTEFPNIRIIDLSHNDFSGLLPLDYFRKWNAMKVTDRNSSYLKTMSILKIAGYDFQYYSPYSMTITYKGMDTEYTMVQEIFTVIDMSSNRFQGEIPECLGSLQGIQVLNLSNNMLIGDIPSSVSNITQLESLDLSHNKLSGNIPLQLAQLTFLAVFSVASNCLTGLIPQGNQFSTFDSSSYEGNMGLCGKPLTKRCDHSQGLDHQGEDGHGKYSQGSTSAFEFSWTTILPGFVGGLVAGVAIEHVLAIHHHEWFVKTLSFGIMIKIKGKKLLRTT